MLMPLCSLARNSDGSFVRPTAYEINEAQAEALTLAAGAVLIVGLVIAFVRLRRHWSRPAAWLAVAGMGLMALHPLWTVSTTGGDCGILQVEASWVVLGLLAVIAAGQLLLLCWRRRDTAEDEDYDDRRLWSP